MEEGQDAVATATVHVDIYVPIYVLTGVFGAIFIIGPFLVPKRNENREVIQHCIMLTAFCMWILWVTIYIAQMHPLKAPRLKNTTMAWLVNGDRELSTTTIAGEGADTTTSDPLRTNLPVSMEQTTTRPTASKLSTTRSTTTRRTTTRPTTTRPTTTRPTTTRTTTTRPTTTRTTTVATDGYGAPTTPYRPPMNYGRPSSPNGGWGGRLTAPPGTTNPRRTRPPGATYPEGYGPGDE